MWASQDNLLLEPVVCETAAPLSTTGNVYELTIDEYQPENQSNYVFEALQKNHKHAVPLGFWTSIAGTLGRGVTLVFPVFSLPSGSTQPGPTPLKTKLLGI